MATPVVNKYQIPVFWNDEYKTLDYIQEPFNDPESVATWISQGYHTKIAGDLCDMRHQLPAWSKKFIDIYAGMGWKDIGLAFYRMPTGTVMPVHQDLYKKYIDIFQLHLMRVYYVVIAVYVHYIYFVYHIYLYFSLFYIF